MWWRRHAPKSVPAWSETAADITPEPAPASVRNGVPTCSETRNDLPSWLSEQQYMAWGREFFEVYEEELSSLTGVPRSELQDRMYISGRYFSKNYSTNSPGWIKYLGGDAAAVKSPRRPKGPLAGQVDAAVLDQVRRLSSSGDMKDALKILSKCMQQFHNMQISDPGNPR